MRFRDSHISTSISCESTRLKKSSSDRLNSRGYGTRVNRCNFCVSLCLHQESKAQLLYCFKQNILSLVSQNLWDNQSRSFTDWMPRVVGSSQLLVVITTFKVLMPITWCPFCNPNDKCQSSGGTQYIDVNETYNPLNPLHHNLSWSTDSWGRDAIVFVLALRCQYSSKDLTAGYSSVNDAPQYCALCDQQDARVTWNFWLPENQLCK